MRIVDFELNEPVVFEGSRVRRRSDAAMRDPCIREMVGGSGTHCGAAALVLTPQSGHGEDSVWVPLTNVRWWVTRVE